MARFALVALLLAACASTPRPAAPGTSAPARYTMQPVKLHGGEGRHSASQSWTTVSGALELAGDRATLQLEMQTDRSHIHCPKAWRDGAVHTMQACAPDDAKDTRTRQRLALTGEARREGGTLILGLRDGDRRIGLRCDEASIGLACAIDDDRTLFAGPGDRPDRLVFATAARKQYRLEPIALPSGEQLQGRLTLAADASRIELALDGKPPIVLPGSAFWAPAGLVVEARTSPTRTWVMSCKDIADRLECEATADRSVLGLSDHLYGPAVFVAN